LVLGRTQFTLAELSPFSHTQCLNAQNRNLDTSEPKYEQQPKAREQGPTHHVSS
jgi:hypothetical protein